MAYQTRDVVDAMQAGSGRPVTELRVDGGAAAMDLLLRLQANLLGVPVVRAAVRDTTALGAAWLAGLAEGVWGSLDDLAARWQSDASVGPAVERTGADASYHGWLQAVQRSTHWSQP
jgi:glycerol kinase